MWPKTLCAKRGALGFRIDAQQRFLPKSGACALLFYNISPNSNQRMLFASSSWTTLPSLSVTFINAS